MKAGAAFLRPSAVAAVLMFVATAFSTPVAAEVCANDPSRTMFVGGPGTDACSNVNDQATCEKSFHRSGAGPLAPCFWESGCNGNTAGFDEGTAQSCEDLPPQGCVDPTRTIALTGGTVAQSGSSVCQSITDEETCEMAWHTTVKGVGIACCWNGNNCVGGANGFWDGTCTHGNTCFLVAGTAPAPATGTWGLLLVGTVLLGMGAVRLRAGRHLV